MAAAELHVTLPPRQRVPAPPRVPPRPAAATASPNGGRGSGPNTSTALWAAPPPEDPEGSWAERAGGLCCGLRGINARELESSSPPAERLGARRCGSRGRPLGTRGQPLSQPSPAGR